MIMVEVEQSSFLMTVTVAGHAGYAESGKDIVCAGVSALFMALCDAAEADGAEHEYLDGPEAKRVKMFRTKSVSHYIRMFIMGVRAVMREYPEYVALAGEPSLVLGGQAPVKTIK